MCISVEQITKTCYKTAQHNKNESNKSSKIKIINFYEIKF